MNRRVPVVAVILALGIVLGSGAGAIAKSIVARLDARLPTNVKPGQQLTIRWTLSVPGNGGLIGIASVLRVFPANGGAFSDWAAHEDRGGHYVATVTVPSSGIETIGIGIPGSSCSGGVCVPAVEFFTVTDPSGAPIQSPGVARPPATDSAPLAPHTRASPSIAMLIAVIVGSVSASGFLWRLRHRRHAQAVRPEAQRSRR